MDKTGAKLLNFWYPTLHYVPTHPTHVPTIFVILSAGQEDRDVSRPTEITPQDGGETVERCSTNIHRSWKSYSFTTFRTITWSGRKLFPFVFILFYFILFSQEFLHFILARSEHSSILQRIQRSHKTHCHWSSDSNNYPLQGNHKCNHKC